MSSERDLVWHYTDTAGLIGMAVHHTIWATGVAFFNDPGEQNYAERILAEGIPGKALREAELLAAPDYYSGFTNRYLFCASMAENDLELWRGYGGDRVSQTFAVGLDPSVPLSVLAPGLPERSKDHVRVTPWREVRYVDAARAVAELKADFVPWYERLKLSMREAKSAARDNEDSASEIEHEYLSDVAERIEAERSRLNGTVKHPAYKAEQEVRVSIDVEQADRFPHKIRQGASGPVPYIELTGIDDADRDWGVVGDRGRLPIEAVITPPGGGVTVVQGVCAALEAGGHAHDHQTPDVAVESVERDQETGETVFVYGRRVTVSRSAIPFV